MAHIFCKAEEKKDCEIVTFYCTQSTSDTLYGLSREEGKEGEGMRTLTLDPDTAMSSSVLMPTLETSSVCP